MYSAGFAVDDLATSDSGAVVRDGNLWVLTEQFPSRILFTGLPTGLLSRCPRDSLHGLARLHCTALSCRVNRRAYSTKMRVCTATRASPQPKPSELTGPARIQQLIAYLTPAAGALPECSVRSTSCLHCQRR